jgi:O-antigen/teichoic acid export membrane protein
MSEAGCAGIAIPGAGRVLVARPAPLSLRRNFVWGLAGNAVYAACQWGMLAVLARLTSPVVVGRYALGLAIGTPIFLFTNLNLAQVQATDARGEYSLGDYRGLRLLSNIVALASVCLWVALARYDAPTNCAVLLIALTKAIESESDVFYGFFQQHECMSLSSLSIMLRGVLSLLVFGSLIATSRQLAAGQVGILLVWSGVLFLFDSRNGARFGDTSPTFNWRALGRLTWLVLPLGVVAGLSSLSSSLPRFFLNNVHGARELGLFAAVASLSQVGTLFSMALSRSAAPRLAQYHAANAIPDFLRLLAKLMGIGLLVGCAGVLVALCAGKWFLTMAFGPEYAQETGVLVWVMVAMGVVTTGTFLGTAVTAARRLAIQMVIHAGKVTVAGAICYLLVPRYGALAAAWSLAASAMLSVLAFAAVTWWIVKARTKTKDRPGLSETVLRPSSGDGQW